MHDFPDPKFLKAVPYGVYRTIVKLIAETTSTTGLTVKVRLDRRKYQKRLKVPDEVLEQLKIQRHDFHGEWNYAIAPRKKAGRKSAQLG